MFRLNQILSSTSNVRKIIYNGQNHSQQRRFITSKEAKSLYNTQDKKCLPDVRVLRNNIDKNIKNASIIGLTECQSFIGADKISFNELLYLQKNLEDDGFKIDREECSGMYKIRVDWRPATDSGNFLLGPIVSVLFLTSVVGIYHISEVVAAILF